jgi:hypothetical protein
MVPFLSVYSQYVIAFIYFITPLVSVFLIMLIHLMGMKEICFV